MRPVAQVRKLLEHSQSEYEMCCQESPGVGTWRLKIGIIELVQNSESDSVGRSGSESLYRCCLVCSHTNACAKNCPTHCLHGSATRCLGPG